MLNINKKAKIPLALMIMSFSGIFLFQYLTFIPEYSHAESISTKPEAPAPTLPEIEGTITTKFGTEAQGYKTYMQEIDLKYCQSLPEKTTGQLADGRDGKIYWVTKLAGTCWMTQDLDLDLGPDGPELTTVNDGDNLYKGSATSWDGGKSVASAESGWGNSNTYANQIKWWDRNSGSNANGAHKAEHTFLGNLYSYEAATAGTGSTVTNDGGEVPGSVCPAGWKLPLGSRSTAAGSFNGLGLTASNVFDGPYYFQLGGCISGSLYDVGSFGYYWSATSYSSTSAYYLYLYSGYANPTLNNARYSGFSVRCVVRDPDYVAPTVPIPSDTDINDPNISVTIPNIITLDVYSDPEDKDNNVVNIDTNTNDISTGTFIAEVVSNNTYNISITAAKNYSTSLIGYKEDNTTLNGREIETITTATTNPPINTWGIRNCTSLLTNSCTESYRPIPAYGSTDTTATNFLTNINKGSNTHLFQIGINIGNDLPSGIYSTNIQVIASSTGSN